METKGFNPILRADAALAAQKKFAAEERYEKNPEGKKQKAVETLFGGLNQKERGMLVQYLDQVIQNAGLPPDRLVGKANPSQVVESFMTTFDSILLNPDQAGRIIEEIKAWVNGPVALEVAKLPKEQGEDILPEHIEKKIDVLRATIDTASVFRGIGEAGAMADKLEQIQKWCEAQSQLPPAQRHRKLRESGKEPLNYFQEVKDHVSWSGDRASEAGSSNQFGLKQTQEVIQELNEYLDRVVKDIG